MRNERILCAAIWYKELPLKNEDFHNSMYLPKNIDRGIVFCGFRHMQCLYSKCALTGLRDCESGDHEQGFLTSHNRFLSREAALVIALRENQVIDVENVRGGRLYSEDLY